MLYFSIASYSAYAGSGMEFDFNPLEYEYTASSTYFQAGIEGQDEYRDDDRLKLWNKLVIENDGSFSENLFYEISGQIMFSTNESDYRGVFTGRRNTKKTNAFVDLSKLSISYEADSYTVFFGKLRTDVGFAEIYSPVNVYSFSNGADPIHAQEFGLWQARVEVPVGDDTASYGIMFFEENGHQPSGASRWQGSSGDSAFFGTGDLGVPSGTQTKFVTRPRDDRPSNWSHIVQYDGIREGLDFFGILYVGPAPYSVLKSTDTVGTFDKVKPWITAGSFGVASTIGAWKIYTDNYLQFSHSDTDDDFLKTVWGISYRETDLANEFGLKEVEPILEISNDVITERQQHQEFVQSSRRGRPHRQSALFQIKVDINDDWSARVGGSFNLRDKDSSSGFVIRYSPNDDTDISLKGSSYSGKDGTQFGRWRKNDFVELEYSLNF
tara:strand:+ start:3567 stop:4880 length:1314 start_codon:yes stop_codon:yes gene_type:complete